MACGAPASTPFQTTASDTQTAALAQRENSADRYAGPQFHGYDPAIANILASLVRQETRAGSARMSRQVVHAFNDDVPLLTNPARHAQFAVLKAADIPSVLVEMGFMSNPLDEAALRRADQPHRASPMPCGRRWTPSSLEPAATLARQADQAPAAPP